MKTTSICYLFGSIALLPILMRSVLNYVFFIDKSKSQRRNYRKKHGFFYKTLCLYALDRKELKNSSYSKLLVSLFLFFLVFWICAILILSAHIISSNGSIISAFWEYIEVTHAVISLLFLFWYISHCKNKKLFTPRTWFNEFYWQL